MQTVFLTACPVLRLCGTTLEYRYRLHAKVCSRSSDLPCCRHGHSDHTALLSHGLVRQQEGAALQMKNNQVTCGVELGLLLLEVSPDEIFCAVRVRLSMKSCHPHQHWL